MVCEGWFFILKVISPLADIGLPPLPPSLITPIVQPPPPVDLSTPAPHTHRSPLMLPSLSSSWLLPKSTARRSFESNSRDVSQLFLIAAIIFSAGYYSAPIFYNSKNLNCIGALSFFVRSVHTFS